MIGPMRVGPLRVGAMLSLTGRFARFGTQAAHGLAAWQVLTGGVELLVEDDRSDPLRVRSGLTGLADRCDLLLGPYSTQLMRAAGEALPSIDHLVWNHGGSGDSVQAAAPGHVISALTPTSRYAESFVNFVAGSTESAPLWLRRGPGSFGRQILTGAAATAARLGLHVVEGGSDPPEGVWDGFVAGTFEDDTALVTEALAAGRPPRTIGSVAAGVQGFAEVVSDVDGVFGVAQWFPGRDVPVDTGPKEDDFLAVYRDHTGVSPDYPAVQAAATAALAVRCAEIAGSTSRTALWSVATTLRGATMFGDFAVDPVSGAQVGHRMSLVRWQDGKQLLA